MACFLTPSFAHPAGGAGVTLWMRVSNPNPFGFTLSTLDTTLMLEGSRAASGSIPLGLPLMAGQTTTVPGLANALRQAATGTAIAYQLDGTVGIDAGRLGQPSFGPMMLASGEIGVRIAR